MAANRQPKVHARTKSQVTNITPVLIVKNEEAVLHDSLDSLRLFAEVVVYLNNSIDSSEAIARSFTNTKVIVGTFLGFGKTRNVAASYASNDWILVVDADERCSDELVASIANFDTKQAEATLGMVQRTNYFMGTRVEVELIPRLYHRNYHQYAKLVHEELQPLLECTTTSIDLSGNLIQQMPDFSKMCAKARQYAKLAVVTGKPRRSIAISFVLAGYKFILWYLLRGGLFKGKAGLLYACYEYYECYIKYRYPR